MDSFIELLVAFELAVLLGVWVSLPLVPAVLIYRYFPDAQVIAGGPLAGLTIKTSGAFAAYLIVLLVIWPLVNTTKDVIGSEMRPFWTVHGKVKLIDEHGKPVSGDDLLKTVRFEVVPDPMSNSAGSLKLKVPQDTGEDLPEIYVVIPNWGKSEAIDLNHEPLIKQWLGRDRFHKTINIGDVPIPKIPLRQVHETQSEMGSGF